MDYENSHIYICIVNLIILSSSFNALIILFFPLFRFILLRYVHYFYYYFVCGIVLLRRHYGRTRDTQRYRDNHNTRYHHSTPERRGQQTALNITINWCRSLPRYQSLVDALILSVVWH